MSQLEFSIPGHFRSCIEMVELQLSDKATELPWRWIIISIHDLLHCILIIKLSRTDMFGVYEDKIEKMASDFYEAGLNSNSPEWSKLVAAQDRGKLAGIATLLDRANLASGIKIHKSAASAHGTSFLLTVLKKRRDSFVHIEDVDLFSTSEELSEIVCAGIDVIQEVLRLPQKRYFDLDLVDASKRLEFIKERLLQM